MGESEENERERARLEEKRKRWAEERKQILVKEVRKAAGGWNESILGETSSVILIRANPQVQYAHCSCCARAMIVMIPPPGKIMATIHQKSRNYWWFLKLLLFMIC